MLRGPGFGQTTNTVPTQHHSKFSWTSEPREAFSKFNWTSEPQSAFEHPKKAIRKSYVLARQISRKTFVIVIDVKASTIRETHHVVDGDILRISTHWNSKHTVVASNYLYPQK
jgi:hypothetical protein